MNSSTIPVARIRPAYQQVADQLRELIVGGSLSPGDRLPVESELTAMFGVSRSTIREALRLLGSQDLINTRRGVTGGTFVSETDASEISEFLETRLGLLTGYELISAEELLEARQLLEVPAARLAAHRRSQTQIEAMRAAIDLERGESERGRRFTHHYHFHSALLDAAGNRLVTVMTVPIFRVIRARFIQSAPSGFLQEVDSDHELILERVAAEDAEGAAKAMAEHLQRLRTTYSRADATPDSA
jgi:GntR family transcriptional repressor for pyruvate dehydrogenase complex